MPSSFERANDRIFARLGDIAEYREQGCGVGVPVRIVLRRPDMMLDGYEDTRLRRPTTIVEVRCNECPRARAGDTFTLINNDQSARPDPTTGREQVYLIDGAPARSDDRTLWICGCREVGE
ncbi:MAG: hypothetical protein DI549_10815 [Ancylobacter novellus]|uniref:Head-tail adaptor protein n=1 Tax=Ancylobacter novellus TaxID=921 RepID=A0A2W5R1E2_ANCNO|nr:MAG: hypothetical protein DI549_10815 [Ancylobacter novellus]